MQINSLLENFLYAGLIVLVLFVLSYLFQILYILHLLYSGNTVKAFTYGKDYVSQTMIAVFLSCRLETFLNRMNVCKFTDGHSSSYFVKTGICIAMYPAEEEVIRIAGIDIVSPKDALSIHMLFQSGKSYVEFTEQFYKFLPSVTTPLIRKMKNISEIEFLENNNSPWA